VAPEKVRQEAESGLIGFDGQIRAPLHYKIYLEFSARRV